MIALDSSALMAIVGKEPLADDLLVALFNDRDVVISATTLAESLVVADRRNVGTQMRTLVAELAPEVIASDQATALRIAGVYREWGKGQHPAQLNLFDCFSYDVAKQHDCPLLYIGNDFAQTDIRSALGL